MKALIIYFSQTGNTEKVAKAIQAGVKQVTGHCDILKLKDANPRRLYEYDLIGLGFPIMKFVEPGNVRAFINNMRFVGGKHVFVFCTHCTMWSYKQSIVPRLEHRGMTVIGARDWYGHSNGPLALPTPYFTDGHPDEIDLKEAKDFGREIVERSRRISAGETSLIPPKPKPEPMPEGYQIVDDALNWRKMAKLNMEKCTYPECRLCMDNCPIDGIDLTVKPPVYANPCIDCMFCGQICPTGAIEIDNDRMEAAAEQMRKLAKETFLPHVLEAKAQGHLRTLVSMEDIGWDTPLFKVYNTNPRWVIGKGRQ